ncbi:hypothetical protein [Nocardia nova]|uniref:hypothetical protein n=1 Tax=Nocardia nova TaxID=37330 RepID=UPI0026BE5DF8
MLATTASQVPDDLVHASMRSYARYWCETFRLPSARMPAGPARLAIDAGAPLPPVHCWFTRGGWGFHGGEPIDTTGGHDVRAFQDVRRMFAGSALKFIRWVDHMAGEHDPPVLAIRSTPSGGAALPEDHREPPNPEPGDQQPHDPGISYAALSGDSLSGNKSYAGSGERG